MSNDWYYFKLNEIERRLDEVSDDLSPRQQERLEEELDEIRKEVGLGKGAFLLGAPNDMMHAGTWSVDERLRQVEERVGGGGASYRRPPTKADENQEVWLAWLIAATPLAACVLWYLFSL